MYGKGAAEPGLDTLMMRPRLCARIVGSTALIHTIGARRLTLRTSHHSSTVMSANAPS